MLFPFLNNVGWGIAQVQGVAEILGISAVAATIGSLSPTLSGDASAMQARDAHHDAVEVLEKIVNGGKCIEPLDLKNWRERLLFKAQYFMAGTGARIEMLMRRTVALLKEEDRGDATSTLYRLGNVFWKDQDWSQAEASWALGASISIGLEKNLDPDDPKIISVLIAAGIVVPWYPSYENPQFGLGPHSLLISRQIGAGNFGTVRKFYRRPVAMKMWRDHFLAIDDDGGPPNPVYLTLTPEGKALLVQHEAVTLKNIREGGEEAVQIYLVGPDYIVRDFVEGPTFFQLRDPKYGLTEEERRRAVDEWHGLYERLKEKRLLSDMRNSLILRDNAAYNVATRKWIIIDP